MGATVQVGPMMTARAQRRSRPMFRGELVPDVAAPVCEWILFDAATAAGSLALLEREARVRDELVDVVVDHPHRRRVGAPVVGRKASNPALASAAEVDSSRISGARLQSRPKSSQSSSPRATRVRLGAALPALRGQAPADEDAFGRLVVGTQLEIGHVQTAVHEVVPGRSRSHHAR